MAKDVSCSQQRIVHQGLLHGTAGSLMPWLTGSEVMPLPVVAEKMERLRPMAEVGFGPQAGMVAARPTGVPASVELLEEMGPKLPVKQAEISKIENRAEILMSTLPP